MLSGLVLYIVDWSAIFLPPLLLVIVFETIKRGSSLSRGGIMFILCFIGVILGLVYPFITGIVHAWLHFDIFQLPSTTGQEGLWNGLFSVIAIPVNLLVAILLPLLLGAPRSNEGQ